MDVGQSANLIRMACSTGCVGHRDLCATASRRTRICKTRRRRGGGRVSIAPMAAGRTALRLGSADVLTCQIFEVKLARDAIAPIRARLPLFDISTRSITSIHCMAIAGLSVSRTS